MKRHEYVEGSSDDFLSPTLGYYETANLLMETVSWGPIIYIYSGTPQCKLPENVDLLPIDNALALTILRCGQG